MLLLLPLQVQEASKSDQLAPPLLGHSVLWISPAPGASEARVLLVLLLATVLKQAESTDPCQIRTPLPSACNALANKTRPSSRR
jgi:hypothetical protein